VFGVIGFLDRRKLCGMRSVVVALVSQEPIAALEIGALARGRTAGLAAWEIVRRKNDWSGNIRLVLGAESSRYRLSFPDPHERLRGPFGVESRLISSNLI
jgi:hypothetical protein